MSELKGACIVAQSGGPTSVINSSAAGVILTALDNPSITRVLAAKNGILGILNDDLFDCGQEDRDELRLLMGTPASALGTCRYKLKDADKDDTDYRRILEIFRKYDVRYFFYNGGNDSMDTCNKVSKFMLQNGYECRIIGVPKTIDNDLAGTDHCPGFASAAKYIATSIAEVSRDCKAYGPTAPVVIFEIMGRNAGWLTAAASLASICGEGPDLVYLPEQVFDLEKFISDIEEVRKQHACCIVAVSEGIMDKDGKYIAEYGADLAKDAFGHSQMGGVAATLTNIVKERLGCKTRGIELSLLQRAAAHCASGVDVKEAYKAGEAAVLAAVSGETDKMVAFKRLEGVSDYVCQYGTVPLSVAANAERKVPDEWVNETKNGMNEKFIDYALPLIQGAPALRYENGLPRFAKLKMVKA